MAKEELIGYDVRFVTDDFPFRGLTQDVRRQFFLRPEIARPLTVDEIWWPSRFCSEGEQGLQSDVPGQLPWGSPQQVDLAVPRGAEATWYFECFDLWNDLGEMTRRYRPRADTRDAAIAIAYVPDPALPRLERWDGVVDFPLDRPDPAWTVLGYDIADQFLRSGLSNCGYDSEREAWRTRWAPHVNEYGLLSTADAAIAFRAASDTRIPEHAPFHVFKLWLVWGML